MSKSVSVTVNNPSLLSLQPSLSHERSQPWLEGMAASFRSWGELSEGEKLLCIAPDKLNNRHCNMAAWDAAGCLEEKWNDTIFMCVLSIMNNAISHRRSGHLRSSERISPILRMLSETGQREDAVPFLILVGEGTKADSILVRLRGDRTIRRYGFCFAAERSKITISGGAPGEDSPDASLSFFDPGRSRGHNLASGSRELQTRASSPGMPRTLPSLPRVPREDDRSTTEGYYAIRSPKEPNTPGGRDRSSQMDESSSAVERESIGISKGDLSDAQQSIHSRPLIPVTNSSVCGKSILVRPSRVAASADRLATIGGIFQLRPGRYFALTSAHIFSEPTVVYESSEAESDVPSPKGSSGDDGSSSASYNGRSSYSSAQNLRQLPEEHYILDHKTSRKIGVAFSQEHRSKYSVDMLYNLALDWALVEMTDPKLWSVSTDQAPSQSVMPRPGAGRTKPPSGDVLVLSGGQKPLRCRSIGTRSAINTDWTDSFIEAWTIEYKSAFGSCGSWVVDPVTEVILGIVVACSEDQPLTWMLPADPIFAAIERRWGVSLTTPNENPLIRARERRDSFDSSRITPKAQSTASKLFPALNLPDDVLEFIQFPMNDFNACSKFISRNRRFISSAQIAWFEDAALEAMRDKKVSLMHQCIQRRIIVHQMKATSTERGQVWLRLLADGDPRVTKAFYETFNGVFGIIQKRMEALPTHSVPSVPPTSYYHGPGTTSITSARLLGSSPPQMTSSANSTLAEGGMYTSRYPVSQGPFDRQGAGQPGVTQPQAVGPTPWQPIYAFDDSIQPAASTSTLPYQPSQSIDHPNPTYEMLPRSWQPSPVSRLPGSYSHYQTGRKNSQSISSFQGSSGPPSVFTEDDLGSVASITSAGSRISASRLRDPELLDPKYKVQNGRSFFVKGRVFAMMYPEPRGVNRNQLNTGDSRFVIVGRDGEEIFSHIKRFAVIRERKGFCLCVPINNYGMTGVSKKQIPREEKRAHAIIYDNRKDPPQTIIPEEEDLVKNPIAVDMNQNDTLHETSRIHFGKIYTIEWNVKVYGIGRIAPQSEEYVEHYWQEELMRKG